MHPPDGRSVRLFPGSLGGRLLGALLAIGLTAFAAGAEGPAVVVSAAREISFPLTVEALGLFQEEDWIMVAADDGHALAVKADEISLLGGPGKGVMVIKLAKGATLLGAELGHRALDAITVETGKGKERNLTLQSLEGTRGGKGAAIVRRGGFSNYVWRPIETPGGGAEG